MDYCYSSYQNIDLGLLFGDTSFGDDQFDYKVQQNVVYSYIANFNTSFYFYFCNNLWLVGIVAVKIVTYV